MSKIEKRNNGYFLITEDGKELECPITKDGLALKLPENPENRTWLMLSKFKNTDVVELNTITKRATTTSTQSHSTLGKLEDFMTDEEKQLIADIKAKAEARREEAKKKATEAKKDPVVKARNRVHNAIEALKALGMSDEAIAKLIKGEQA